MTDMTKLLKFILRTKLDKGRTTPFCPPAEAGERADGHGQGYIPCPPVRPRPEIIKFSPFEGCNLNALGITPAGSPGVLLPLRWAAMTPQQRRWRGLSPVPSARHGYRGLC